MNNLANLHPRIRKRFELSNSILDFGKFVSPHIFKKPSAPFHSEVERRIMDLNMSLQNIVTPRGTAKTTIACVYNALWHISLEHYYRMLSGYPIRGTPSKPEHSYVMLISKTQEEAKQRLRMIRQVLGDNSSSEQSPTFKALMGDWSENTSRLWTQSQLILKDGTTIRANGTGQAIHGLNEGGVRPTLCIVDDPEDHNNTKTEERRRGNMKWLYESVIPGLYPGFGRLVVIGTPLHTQCMVVELHRTWGRSKSETDTIWFRQHLGETEIEDEHHNSISKEDVDIGMDVFEDQHGLWQKHEGLIWPEQLNRKKLISYRKDCIESRTLSLAYFARQYECKIRSDEEATFKDEWFDQTWEGSIIWDEWNQPFIKVYRRGEETFEKPLMIPVGVSSGYDPAYSVHSTSSHTAAANIATDCDDFRYELPCVYGRFEASKMMTMFLENQKQWRPSRALCEANGPQLGTYEALRRAGLYAWKDSNMDKAKISRIEALQYPMSNGMFYFRASTPARPEAQDYPVGSLDYMDALEKADRVRVRGPRHLQFKDTKRSAYISEGNAMTA